MSTARPSRAFTLAEMIVAVIVTSILGSAVLATMSHLTRVRSATESRHEAFSRADAAAGRIALDVMTLVRDHELTFCRVRVVDQEAQGVARDELLLLVRSLRRVRPLADGPESAEQEAQYRVAAAGEGTALWRRADHAMDRAQDAGGIARPIVPNVVSLSIQAADGDNWYDVWDSDYDGLPHALRITVVAQSDPVDGRAPVTATARRIISIDRVPLPPETLDEGDIESPDASDDTPGGDTGDQQGEPGAAPGGDAGGAVGGGGGR